MIKLNNINKTYCKGKSNAVDALKNVSLHIENGELAAIIGKSGSGKTTLLNIIGCIDTLDSGSYYLNGNDIKVKKESELSAIRNKNIGIVMQEFALIGSDTALENVMLPFYFDDKASLKSSKALAINALKSVGMDNMAEKPVNKLSGGQKQRVAIARAIVHEPSVILADEPTGSLDTKTAAEIMEVFHWLNEKGHTIIIVTHDQEIAKQCGRIIEISDGQIVN